MSSTDIVKSIFFVILLVSCGSGENNQTFLYENIYGMGEYPILSPCMGKPDLMCVYFSDTSGAIRLSPVLPSATTSTYAFIPEEGNRAIPVIFSPSLTAFIEIYGDAFSKYRVMSVSGDLISSEFVKLAVGKYFGDSSAIGFYSPENVFYLILTSGGIKRKEKIPGFFNNSLDRRGSNLIEILDSPGRCIDIAKVGRLLMIVSYSASFDGLKFYSYDLIDNKFVTKEVTGWEYGEFSTYPNPLTELGEGYYYLGLKERAFPSSEVAGVIPQVRFGFLDENNVWIFTDEPEQNYTIKYIRPSGSFSDSCAVIWWEQRPAVFTISEGKLIMFTRISDWSWEKKIVDEDVFGDISAFSVSYPCVIYSKLTGLNLSCNLPNGWKTRTISPDICAQVKSYFDEKSNRVYITCVSNGSVVKLFSVDVGSVW